MFGLFTKKSDGGDAAVMVKRALDPEVVAIVSASCCMPGTAQVDGEVEAVVRAALNEAGLDWPILAVTVTQAQGALGRISGELTREQGALATQVSELFLSSGLGAFPVLLVNQRLLTYGGVPSQDLVRAALPTGTHRRGVLSEAAA